MSMQFKLLLVHSIESESFLPPFFVSLTIRLLEAVAPLVVRQLAVLEGVAGIEKGFHAQLIFV